MKIGIVGGGQMGLGIARLASRHHPRVLLYSRKDIPIQKLNKGIQLTNTISSLSDCTVIIEAIKEDFEEKSLLLHELTHKVIEDPSKCLIASNTSSLSIGQLSKSCQISSRMVGIHFLNPISKISICELISPFSIKDNNNNSNEDNNNNQTLKEAMSFIKSLGKEAIIVPDRRGFVINRLLMPQIREAILMLEEGDLGAVEIDRAYMLGTLSKIGPLALADYIGLDVCLQVIRRCSSATQQPPALLVEMVNDSLLGRKTGKGFHNYYTNKNISNINKEINKEKEDLGPL